MLHILIVDDEPNIVEGLCHLIQAMDEDNLSVSKAYSGREALAVIEESPVDLVLSDIRMPGMSGLQLLSALERIWPSCRIVFLTGYSEFEYIHTAIKSPQCAGYLLKTEGDDEIIAVVRRELDGIRQRRENNTLPERARDQMTAMVSLLRERHLHALVTEGSRPEDRAQPDAAELGLHINLDGPVLAAVGVIPPGLKPGNLERARLAITVNEALADVFGGRARWDFTLMEPELAVWLIQPAEPIAAQPAGGPGFTRHVGAGLQLVQDGVRQAGPPISFALASEPVPFDRLPEKVRALQALALSMGAADGEMVVQERMVVERMTKPEGGAGGLMRLQFPALLRKLEPVLMEGSAAEFQEAFRQSLGAPGGGYAPLDSLCQTMLLSMLLETATRLNLSADLAKRVRLADLFPAGEEPGESPERFLRLGQEICRLRALLRKNEEEQSVERIKRYVAENITDKNLSLSGIAAHTFYNPSYLSRFFKQKTGANLSEYINEVRLERALTLLRNREVRINEITNRVGFESPSYFTMFFKRRMGVTPNEYRASMR